MSPLFRYCPYCAGVLQPLAVEGVLRQQCPSCGWIHYRNPTVGVAVVLLHDKQILLGLRRDGGWCIPCGHVEWDETVQQAAVREFMEETGVQVELDGIIAVHSNFHDPEYHTVGVWFRGNKIGGELRAGGDLTKVAFWAMDRLPPLKFPTDQRVVLELMRSSKYG